MTNITSISSTGTYLTSGTFDEVSISAGSIRLNGTTQYLQASGVSGLSGNSFTLETWMYFTGYSSNVGIHYPVTPAGTSAHGLSIPSLTNLGNGTYTYTYGLGRTFNPGDSVTLWFTYQIYTVINGRPRILEVSPATSVSTSVVSNSGGTLVVSLSDVANSQAQGAINRINGQGINGGQYIGDVDIYVVLNSANSSTPVNIDPYCPIFSSGNNGLTLSIPNTSSSYTAINITANGSLVHSFNKSFSLNQWYHIALTSDNDAGVFTVYVNGYSLGSVSNSVSWTDSSPYTIGYESANSFHFGPAYLSNFRIVNGSVIYNGIFTPSVNALLPVSNTALLLTANPISPLSDTSGNNITVSGVNSPTANTISPFYEPGNIVSSSVGRVNDPTIGSSRKVMRSVDPYGNVMPSGVFDEVSLSSGSILLNGSTQYLTVSNVGGLSGNALTLETWVYMTGYSSPTSSSPIFSSGSNGLTLSILNTASSYTGMGLYANGSLLQSFNKSFSLNQWYHIALTRNSSGVFTVYVNGSSIGTVTNTTTWTDSSPYNVGYDSSTSFYFGPGYLSNFRIVDGSVVYSSNFTPADGPLLPVGNTGLLLTSNPMNPFADTSGNNVSVSLVANPSFSTISPFYAAGKASSSVGTVSNPTLGSAVQIAQSMDLNGNIMMSNGFDEVSS